jgi:hypothetical protein
MTKASLLVLTWGAPVHQLESGGRRKRRCCSAQWQSSGETKERMRQNDRVVLFIAEISFIYMCTKGI